MKKSILLVIAISLVLCSSICRKTYTLLSVGNRSNKSIYFTYSNSFPDTSVDNSVYVAPGGLRLPSQLVQPGQTIPVNYGSLLPIDEYYAEHIPSGIFQVFIYDANVVDHTPWDSVRAKYLVLKRYELTLDSFKKMNETIVYPN